MAKEKKSKSSKCDTYNLAVPRFVNGSQMLGSLFHKRKKDEAEELIGYTGFNHIFDALDKEDGEQRDESE